MFEFIHYLILTVSPISISLSIYLYICICIGINPLIAACSEGHVEIVKQLLSSKDVDPNTKDKDGTNALMAASVRGHKEVVTLLLEKKVLVNAQNVDGHTALMFAFNGKNQVETLLDKYTEYIKDDSDNSTKVILEALKSHSDVVNLLIQNGADPSLKVNKFINIFLNK